MHQRFYFLLLSIILTAFVLFLYNLFHVHVSEHHLRERQASQKHKHLPETLPEQRYSYCATPSLYCNRAFILLHCICSKKHVFISYDIYSDMFFIVKKCSKIQQDL